MRNAMDVPTTSWFGVNTVTLPYFIRVRLVLFNVKPPQAPPKCWSISDLFSNPLENSMTCKFLARFQFHKNSISDELRIYSTLANFSLKSTSTLYLYPMHSYATEAATCVLSRSVAEAEAT